MKPKHVFVSTFVLISFGMVTPVWADDLRSAMEADNVKWLQAFNTRNTKVMPAMYTQDAIILAPNSTPVKGREAIGQFWDKMLKDGKVKDHTFDIVDAKQVGNEAYQVARYTLVAITEDGKSTKAAGNAVRIFERQPDGTWLTKVQIFN